MIKKILRLAILLTVITMFTGCGVGSQAVVTATPTPSSSLAPEPTKVPQETLIPTPAGTATPTPSPEPTKDPDGEYFEASSKLENKIGRYLEKFYKDSELSLGNGYRLTQKLNAAKNGEEITCLFIGGSVTEGAQATERTPKGYQKGYAYCTYEYIRDNYGAGDGSNVKYVNVGVSGTSSALGIMRVQGDVLDYNPDIIFIEFAVNNSTSIFDKQTFESLIRRCLKAENEPAVVLLFSAATYAGQTQTYMWATGKYYSLPMMSMNDGLKVPQMLNAIKWSDFSGDSVHPGQEGHRLYAKAISKMLKHAYENNTDTEYVIPEKPYVNNFDAYENMVMIDNSNAEGYIVDTGCFEAVRTPFSSTGGSDNHALENGWVKKAGSGDEPFVIKLTCNSFAISAKQISSKNEVSLDVYVDGERVKSIVTSKEGAWNNPDPQCIFLEAEAKEHTIEIRTNETSANATATILAMAYTNEQTE